MPGEALKVEKSEITRREALGGLRPGEVDAKDA